jgi:hypothetical protein
MHEPTQLLEHTDEETTEVDVLEIGDVCDTKGGFFGQWMDGLGGVQEFPG